MYTLAAHPVTAVLGPTNTGKTHYALERMWAHESGVFGCPLRLLAREVYEKTVAARGVASAALITGEEKIIPPGARYRICTVEAMPRATDAAFVAVDEVQLIADRERGHVFTDRVLHLRGRYETLLLGAETVRPLLRALLGETLRFMTRPRFSALDYVGVQKLQHLPRRSAVIAFSMDEVYALAELLRRTRGGTAVITGGLSPRARNAQAALFRSGEVDFLVATDAIGMGLNLDVAHVVFAGAEKFDGDSPRRLRDDELAQIAGRAGRYTQAGTFAVLPDVYLSEDTVRAMQNHRFEPVRAAYWRNPDLRFDSEQHLLASLEKTSGSPLLRRAPKGDDALLLQALLRDPSVVANTPQALALLWQVASIPDFTQRYHSEHFAVVKKIYIDLRDKGNIDTKFFEARLRRFDELDGDLHTLSARIAGVRTLGFAANRSDWLPDAEQMRLRTRAVEDRLSDALHAALTARFVDRRTASLMRKLHLREIIVTDIAENGTVFLENRPVGRLLGFVFLPAEDFSSEERRLGDEALTAALQVELRKRLSVLVDAGDKAIRLSDEGLLAFGDEPLGRLSAGADIMNPVVDPIIDTRASGDLSEALKAHLSAWFGRYREAVLGPLLQLKTGEGLQGFARGFAFSLYECGGTVERAEAVEEVHELTSDDRAALRKAGVRVGEYFIYMREVLRPAAVRLKLILQAIFVGAAPILPPEPGVPAPRIRGDEPEGYWQTCGYMLCGGRAVRYDIVEKLADALREPARRGVNNPTGEFSVTSEMMSIVGRSGEDFAAVLVAMGYESREQLDEGAETPRLIWRRKPRRAPTRSGQAGAGRGDARAARGDDRAQAPRRQRHAVADNAYAGAVAQRADGGEAAPRSQSRRDGRSEHRGDTRGENRNERHNNALDPHNPFAALAGYLDRTSP